MWPAVPTTTFFSPEDMGQENEPLALGGQPRGNGEESGVFDFLQDGLGRGAGVGGGNDGASDDDVIRAGADRIGRCRGAGLIVALAAHAGFLGAHARSDDKEVAAAGFADGASFLDGG